jgi:hypothetical protein
MITQINKSDSNQISHLLPFTDILRRGGSEETSLRVTCEKPYVIDI